MSTLTNYTTLLLVVLSLFLGQRVWRWRRTPFPPGPRGIPLVGNIFDLPKKYEWIHWAKYKDMYGPISSVSVMGTRIVLLNSLDACIELLERRSSIYSNRPVLPFAGEMIGWSRQLILCQYSDRFRAMRKMLFGGMGTKAAAQSFVPIQELETRYFLLRVTNSPTELLSNIRLMTGAILLKISHGYTIETQYPDPLINTINTAADEFHTATQPGAWLIDTFPWLQYVPDWMPGSGFKKVAQKFRKTLDDTTNLPHRFVEKSMLDKNASPSFTSALLSNNLDSNEIDIMKCASASLYGGGTDTVSATISAFFLAMILYPDIQRKAQLEIDQVVGYHRLPTLEDRDQLPYLNAVHKEVLRWHVVGPMGIPHCSTTDDEYEGYLIPKGSLVMGNAWQISQDESHYSTPASFMPERFLSDDGHIPELDPRRYVFGFGRRRCPGIELADTSVFIAMAMSLSVFVLGKAKDQDGFEITPELKPTSGTVSHPVSYEYNIQPRSSDTVILIQSLQSEHPLHPKSDAETLHKLKAGDGDS
ncbi:cytochrome P450 monooxygenase [Crucibulum laeve]|uniref:Cytochrome P450 monooxygenase n=1 Tax=Crucibulum laeve TaxID=68775 RepID=A0A5C3LIF9_9AGAR|nr:cytochrome P450 monooxygenase [Crucibulum laeve]